MNAPLIAASLALLANAPETEPVVALIEAGREAADVCYQEAKGKTPALEGRLRLELTLGKSGAVDDVTVAEDHLGDAGAAGCMVTALRSLRSDRLSDTTVTFWSTFSPRARSVAILPFANTANDEALSWLGHSLSETLSSRLGNARDLVIVERNRLADLLKEQALAQVLGAEQAAETGQLIGADRVVVGSFQVHGKLVRLQARVVDSSTAAVVATAEARGSSDDVFALEDKLAQRLAQVLNVSSQGADVDIKRRVARSRQALQVLGEASQALYGEPRDLDRARALYRQLLVIQPSMPEAHLGVAYTHIIGPRPDGWSEAAAVALEAALVERPSYHEALSLLAMMRVLQGRADDADPLIRRAIEAKPEHALGYYSLGMSYAARGMMSEAIASVERSIALDPRNSEYETQLGELLAAEGKLEQALLHTRAGLDKDGAAAWSHYIHANVLFLSGDAQGCLQAIAEGRQGDDTRSRFYGLGSAFEVACLARQGKKAEASAALAALPADTAAILVGPPSERLPPFKRKLLLRLQESVVGLDKVSGEPSGTSRSSR